MRNHHVPVLPERADMLLAVGKIGDQQSFSLRPYPSPILFYIPLVCADVVEEPFALSSIGNDIQEGGIRVIVNKNHANVENDMLDLCHPNFFSLRTHLEWRQQCLFS